AKARFVGIGSAPGVQYDFGWYAGAVFKADGRSRVIGEFVALKKAERLIAQPDHWEGTAEPDSAFRRVAVKVSLDRGGAIEAWTYELNAPPGRPLIGSGDFILHRGLREQRPLRP